MKKSNNMKLSLGVVIFSAIDFWIIYQVWVKNKSYSVSAESFIFLQGVALGILFMVFSIITALFISRLLYKTVFVKLEKQVSREAATIVRAREQQVPVDDKN
jgi:Kef-type K+ transport system membrane component KefB